MSRPSTGADAGKTRAKGVSRDGAAPRLPGADEARLPAQAVQAFINRPEHAAVLRCLHTLASSPPQVLLLEGGAAQEREYAAFYWTLLLNCPQSFPSEGGRPCLACSSCLHFLNRMHRDLFFMDGAAGAIKIDEVRAIREILPEAPRDAVKRVVILAEAQSLTEAAANALLKALEEPRPHTVFTLLAPQRERLLPTLVSRAWTLTLAWPDPHAPTPVGDAGQWEEALGAFLLTGRGLLGQTGTRAAASGDAMDGTALARHIVHLCEKALAQALSGRAEHTLARLFAALSPQSRFAVDALLLEAQDSLLAAVNPTLVTEWLAMELFLLLERSGAQAAYRAAGPATP